MKSKRSLRFFSKTMTAVGLTFAVSACTTVYKDDWDQTSSVPDLNQPTQRSEALLDYCKSLHERGDLNLAAGICNRAHEVNPTDPAPLIELARVMESMEMTASAEEAYRAALLLDPQQTDALYGLGKIYIDQQRYDLATGPLEAAAASDVPDPRIYNALGVIKDQQGQHLEAQAYYQQGLTHSPRNISLRNNLGLSMVLAGEPDAGLAMLREVAAEPAAGATAGRNLEMASQIAANAIVEESEQTGELPASSNEDLSTLTPSSGADDTDGADTPTGRPLPLVQPRQIQQSEATPAAQPATPTQMPHDGLQSLDHDLADAMVEPTAESDADDIETAAIGGEKADERAFAPSEPKQAAPEQVAAVPEGESAADQEAAAAPAPAATSTISRDWSLAAQTAFAKSGVAVPEPSKITAQDRIAANDSFHAAPAPDAADAAAGSSTEPTMTVQSSEEGDLTLSLAGQDNTSPISQGYPIDENVFYTAQLASFLTADRARDGWRILQSDAGDLLDESDGYIVRADLGPEQGTYYRVRTGMMEDRAAADQFCQDLNSAGVECMAVEATVRETNETLVDKICQSESSSDLCRTVERSKLIQKGAPHGRG